jgi:hypothetical protein
LNSLHPEQFEFVVHSLDFCVSLPEFPGSQSRLASQAVVHKNIPVYNPLTGS